MFSTIMPKSGFRLRPLEMSDAKALQLRILGDPDIARTLAHDASSPEACRDLAETWCRDDAIDSPESNWDKLGVGLWAVLDKGGQLAGTRGFFLDPALPDHCVEAFVAIAKPYWGRGLSSESSQILLDYVFKQTKTEAVYTNIWPLLNPGSEAVQRKIGFTPVDRVTVRDSFGEERMRQISDFELWRLRNATSGEADNVLRQVGIKLGQLAAEGLFSREIGRTRILEQLEDKGCTASEDLVNEVDVLIEEGYSNPAWATYRFSRADWESRRSRQMTGN